MASLNTIARTVLAPLSDRHFSNLQYFRSHRRFPDWNNPRTFNEQIQWLKIYYQNPLMRICADKFTVRSFVEDKGYSRNLIPLLGVYDNATEIEYDQFPDKFVLKASHGSGWNILCRNSKSFDKADANRTLNKWLSLDFSRVGREWAYKNLKPRIICEEFLEDSNGEAPWDYKLFCFHGIPKYIQVDYARFTQHTRAIYDVDWKRIPCKLEYALETTDSPRPQGLAEMLELARQLSAPFPFVRVDLYEVSGKIFLGELTFYPGKGVEHFTPSEFDNIFGRWMNMSSIHQEIRTDYNLT